MQDAIATAVRLLPAPPASGPDNLEVGVPDRHQAVRRPLRQQPVAARAARSDHAHHLGQRRAVRAEHGQAARHQERRHRAHQRRRRVDRDRGVVAARSGRPARSACRSAGAARARAATRNGAGFDVYPLRTTAAPYFVAGAKVEKTGKHYTLSQTQEHDVMEGRPIALDESVDGVPQPGATSRSGTRPIRARRRCGRSRTTARAISGAWSSTSTRASAAARAPSRARPRTTCRPSARTRSAAAARCTGCASTATTSATTPTSRRWRSSRSLASTASKRRARTSARSTRPRTAPKA